MVRTVVHLTEAQAILLRDRAREQGVSVSELVRQGVDVILRSGISNAEVRRRAKEAVGFVNDQPDLSIDHDRHLVDAYITRRERIAGLRQMLIDSGLTVDMGLAMRAEDAERNRQRSNEDGERSHDP